MLISGFSYIRNGFTFGYPFLQSIRSILPICDEFIMAVGDSTDGTREAIEKLDSEKIKIIDTIWDENLREGGQIFAQQANVALDNISGDWGFHIQADEIIHEDDLGTIKDTIVSCDKDERVEGLLFKFLNFCGSYDYIGSSRSWHRYEIRIIRNKGAVRSYRDSQGFRKYTSLEAFNAGEKGEKLKVKKVDASVYHYNYVRNPKLMKKKSDYFHRFWHDDNWLEDKIDKEVDFGFEFDGELEKFNGTHPKLMYDIIKQQDWQFIYDKSKIRQSLRERILNSIEKRTGWRIGEYKNYILLK